MTCKKCGSENVTVTAVGNVKSRGGTIPAWYWISCLWMIEWVLLMPVYKMLKRKAKQTKTTAETHAICQNCGYSWKV